MRENAYHSGAGRKTAAKAAVWPVNRLIFLLAFGILMAAVFGMPPGPAAMDHPSAGPEATAINGQIQKQILEKWIESQRLTGYTNLPNQLSIRYNNPRVKVTYEMVTDPKTKYKVRVKKVEPLVR